MTVSDSYCSKIIWFKYYSSPIKAGLLIKMSLQESYNLLETMSKRFKVGDNTMKTVQDNNQRTASSIVNNSTSEQKDQLCANMISEIVKLANEKVQGKQSRTASVTTNKIDEVGLLKSFLSAYQ
jgi:hypothetical protein